MPEGDALPPDASATDFVAHLAQVSGLPASAARERTAEVLRHVGLYEERYRQMGGYSTGMRQRVETLGGALERDGSHGTLLRIPIQSWHWQMKGGVQSAVGRPGIVGAMPEAFVVSILPDAAAASFLQLGSGGRHFNALTAEVRQGPAPGSTYFLIALSDAYITGIARLMSSSGTPVEQVTFAYGAVHIDYKTPAAAKQPAQNLQYNLGQMGVY